MSEELKPCPDGLLPDGEWCPRCGGPRGPSGVDGGSWVHYRGQAADDEIAKREITAYNWRKVNDPSYLKSRIADLERALAAADALLDCIPDFTDGRNDDVVDEYERLRAATLPAAIKESER